VTKAAIVLSLLLLPLGVLAADKPTYTERKEQVKLPNRSVELRCTKPVSPRAPAFLVIFASGDGGLRGDSGAVFQHMAERGQYVAAYSSREAIAQHKGGNLMTLQEAAADIEAMMREAKRLLDLPEATPTVVTGVSRGASMVVFAAAEPKLRAGIAGAIAIALTRESDYVKAPAPDERTALTTLDEKGRILTYPLLDQIGSTPIAVIQSTGDSYIGAKESRLLMGPDTATRRLYEVEAKNHSFSGGVDEMLRDVDLALDWIAASIQAGR
jgi:type IV secretory pathway VirJ component